MAGKLVVLSTASLDSSTADHPFAVRLTTCSQISTTDACSTCEAVNATMVSSISIDGVPVISAPSANQL